ncbi:PREDICTED: rRNA methyltransferase 3, mitochondrial [Poecilia mexicana]|uniref:RNA 2-O ribose methyltransferase substrate binding domain-containing protein n=1 Tax=Poecilia mexicana TaxID=48701 RepID=A0A3B3XVY9_9TELE|nr:PREDICTED: rRNA methyltransferase 3, mitochondrial [Poecilia mexicana]
MAALIRGVIRLLPVEKNVFLSTRSDIIVESTRFLRGLRRKPVRVLFPDNDAGKVVKPPPQQQQQQQHPQAAEKKMVRNSPTAAGEQPDRSDAVNMRSKTLKEPYDNITKDSVDGLRYERALPGDKRLSRLVSVAQSRKFREQQGKILLEGRRLICDALEVGARPQIVFFSMADRLRELPLDKLRGATVVKVKFEDIKIWSDVVAPQGVIAIFARPDPARLSFSQRDQSLPLSLICDNVRDPGNLGTMLRCAAAAGCHEVLLTKGCVDVWEPKVLRAGMGAHFRLPVYPNLDWDEIRNHLPNSVTAHVADIRDPDDEDGTNKLSKPGDYGWVSTSPKRKTIEYEEYDSDFDSDSDSEDEGLSLPRVETKLYHENWAQSPTALVIGGETRGLSTEAARLAEKTDGSRLFIPIVSGVDSLNSAMAASILLFEGRRQLSMFLQTAEKKRQSKAERKFS